MQTLTKDENQTNLRKNKNYLNIKKEILIHNHKDNHNLNKFLKSPNTREKKSLPTSSSHKLGLFYSPNPHKGKVANIFNNNKFSYIKNSDENIIDNKNIIGLKERRNKKIIFINNIKKDFTDFNPNSNKYFNNYIKNKKHQTNNQINFQLISLSSQPNENEPDKNTKKANKTNDINLNISSYKNGKSTSKENIKQKNDNSKNRKKDDNHNNNNNEGKITKTEISKNISLDKKRNKKNNNNKSNDIEKGDDKLIKTKISLDKIKHIIKKYVGNNVLEGRDSGNFKFICKAKCGKDDLIFHLELISKSFDALIFEGKLIKGETKLYKELFFKIKEKLI